MASLSGRKEEKTKIFWKVQRINLTQGREDGRRQGGGRGRRGKNAFFVRVIVINQSSVQTGERL